jgi:CRISPR-associated endoribonuclease Cas6
MRIKITLEPKDALTLPIHYGEILQGFIYAQLEPQLANWLHGNAYRVAKKTYKMLTFSRLEAVHRYEIIPHEHGKKIRFYGPVSFCLSAYNADVLGSFAEHLLSERYDDKSIRLGQHECKVRGVEILPKPRVADYDKVVVKAISPITVHRTLHSEHGAQQTYYFTPFEEAWSQAVINNLADKAKALGWEDGGESIVKQGTIKPKTIQQSDKAIINYKDFTIQSWRGVYELNLPQAYFHLAYDAGLGARNAQGFGMIEVI